MQSLTGTIGHNNPPPTMAERFAAIIERMKQQADSVASLVREYNGLLQPDEKLVKVTRDTINFRALRYGWVNNTPKETLKALQQQINRYYGRG